MAAIEKRVFSGSVANGFLFIFSFVQSIALVPIFLNRWGNEKYGIWIALSAFFTLMKTFDLGHQNYIGNEINKFYYTDLNKAKEIFSSGLKIAYFIGFLELVVGTFLLLFFGNFFWGINKSDLQFNQAFYGVITLLIMWMIIGSIGGIWARLLIATGAFARATYWGIAYKILETVVLLFAAFQNLPILVTCIVLAVTTLIYAAISIDDIKRLNPDFHQFGQFGDIKVGWRNFCKSIVITLAGFMEQTGNNLQIVGITSHLGRGLLPIFTTVKTITNVAVQVSNIFTGPITIDVIRLFIRKENEKLNDMFSLIWLASSVLIYIPFVILTPFIEKIYNFWTHNLLKFDHQLYYLLSFTVCIVSFGSPFKLLLVGTNHLKALIILSTMRLLLLCLIPFGIKSLGLTMIGISVLLSELFASAILPYLFVKSQLRNMGGKLNKKVLGVSILPLAFIALFFLSLQLNIFNRSSLLIMSSVVLIFFVIIIAVHWRLLTLESRDKITKSFFGKLTISRSNKLN